MSPGRLAFFLSASGLSVLWALMALSVSATRFEYRNMIASIRAGEEAPSPEALSDALNAYVDALHTAPCNAGLHDDMALLLGQHTDAVLATGGDEDNAFGQLQEELATQLSCNPMDGKAWLDFASLDIYREGFTPRALDAYRMSARVAPGESWLAKKRLLFALQFRGLFDAKGMTTARADITKLKHAHPNHMTDVLKVADAKDVTALNALFAAPAAAR